MVIDDRGTMTPDAPASRVRRALFQAARPLLAAALPVGRTTVRFGDQATAELGDGSGTPVIVRLVRLRALARTLLRGDLGLGESYMDGDWALERGDLAPFFGRLLVARNRLLAKPGLARLNGWRQARRRRRQRNSPGRARRNAAAHYDLGNDLYESFLDPGMTYSCAFFATGEESLAEAQNAKIRTALARLEIGEGAAVLDIGCGWGETARRVAAETPARRITGLTLAERQIDVARARLPAAEAGRLSFRLEDYRDHAAAHPSTYDRIVSIGMFEHVGPPNYGTFFRAVRRLLAPGGRALIHTILRADPKGGVSRFTDRYIFPGGAFPHLPEMMATARRAGLALAAPVWLHSGANYAETLRRWRANFEAGWPVIADAYGPRFRRMWQVYLAGSEAAFEHNGLHVGQILLGAEEELGAPAGIAGMAGPVPTQPGDASIRPRA